MRTGALATLLAAALLVAGCGGSSTKSNGEAAKSPQQVVSDAQTAATSASAVHVAGSIVDNGTPISLDMRIVKGKGGEGSLTLSGMRVDIVRLGNRLYFRGSDAFLRKYAGTVAPLFHGRWFAASATTGEFAAFMPLTDTAQLFKGVSGSHGTLKNEGETTYEGQKAVAIRDTTKGGTLYVAATGSPYPLALVGSSKQPGTITFTDWNKTSAISAPPHALDFSKLSKG